MASAAMIARKPASRGDIEAASVPVIAVTAWQALFDEAGLAAGQTVQCRPCTRPALTRADRVGAGRPQKSKRGSRLPRQRWIEKADDAVK